ncbi:MAG TPA: DinB family protein [Vicinamibacterales bacterium]
MKLNDLFAAEIEREGALTRRALERVPEGRDEWKPHDKSMPLGRLAMLVASMPSWIAMMLQQDEFDLNPPGGGSSSFNRELKTNRELLQALEKGVQDARAALQRASEEDLQRSWRLLVGGNVVSEKARHLFIRETINHLAHHRGQLTVYLRMNDVAVPSIYGPSADDQRFD